MLSLANIYTYTFNYIFRLCICLNKLSINQSIYLYYMIIDIIVILKFYLIFLLYR